MAYKHSRPWWGAPKNFDERKQERKVSWLELFYDLVYVAVIAQLTQQLAAHPSWNEIAFSFLLFSLVFWSWVNGSQYYDLHGSDSVRTRLFTFLQMLAVAAVAVTIHDTFAGHHQAFAIAFGVVQLVITYLWWSVGLWDPSHRVFNKFYTFNYLIAFALLISSIFVSHQVATIFWIAVLLLNLTPGLIGARTVVTVLKERGQVFSASASIVERFGLFTIIVLAESVLGTVSGVAEIKDQLPAAWAAFISGLFISFLLWSLYFDMTNEQETKPGYKYLQWLIFLHFPLLFALGVVGACIKVLLAGMQASLHLNIQWMFCIAIASILLMIVSIAALMKEVEEDRAYIRPASKILFVITLLILCIPFFGQWLNTLAFLSIMAFLLFVPVLVGIRNWIRYKFYRKE